MTSASIIIPAYNAEGFISETLNSIRAQLEPEDEIILVDDGSTDNTLQEALDCNIPNLRYISQPNSGRPSVPRNRGIELASNELILVFDSDDLMYPGKLEMTKNAYSKHQDVGLICSNFSGVDEKGTITHESYLENYDFFKKKAKRSEDKYLYLDPLLAFRMLASENFVGTSSVAIPKKVINEIAGFREDLANADDRELWLRITTKFPLVFINKPLHYYRLRTSGNISSKRIHLRAEGKKEALLSHYRNQQDSLAALELRKSIGDVIYAEAYDHFLLGNMPESRSALTKNGVEFLRKKHYQLFFKSLLGHRGVKIGRRLKKKLKPTG